jgi:hypothetical protein
MFASYERMIPLIVAAVIFLELNAVRNKSHC